MLLQIREFSPNLDIASAVIYRKLLGDEAVDELIAGAEKREAEGEASWWDQGWLDMREEDVQESIREKELLQAQQGQTKDIIGSFQEGDVGGVIAGAVNAFTSLGSSAAVNTLTAGGGLFTDFFANSYIDYNTAVAEREGKSLEQLRADDEDSFWTPFVFSTLMGASEKFGLDNISRAAAKSIGSKGAQRAVNYLLAGTSEGGTEIVQTMLEKSQQELGETGDSAKAAERFFTALGEQDTWEAGIQGFIGGAGFSGNSGEQKNLRKASYNLRDKYEQDAIDTKVEQKVSLKKKLAKTTDEDVKKILNDQINEIDKHIARDVKESNDVVERLNDDQLERVKKKVLLV